MAADEHHTPEHRFSLGSLMGLLTVCSVIAALAARFPAGIPIFVPPLLGPFVAWSIVPNGRSQFLGLVAAYFWTTVLALAVGAPIVFVAVGKSSPSGYVIVVLASMTSLLGGYLGAMVERSRLHHLARQRAKKLRADDH